MKKKLMMILLGGTVLMPTNAMAQDNGGGYGDGSGNGNGNGPYYSPGVNLGAIITYNESSNTAYVWFTTAVDDAEITICIDGVVVDTQTFDVEAGSQIPLSLSAYGSGELAIYVRRGTTLLAYYCTSI